MKKSPIGVVKDSAIKCEFEKSLKPLSFTPQIHRSVTKNVSVMESEAPIVNINKIKGSYYNYYVREGGMTNSSLQR